MRHSASELQTRVEALARELEEARAEQAATAAVLRVIASSPTDVQPVLDEVVASAAKLCNSYDAVLLLRNGDALDVCAHFGPVPIDFSAVPLARDWAVGKSVLDCVTIHVPDLAAPDHEFAAGRASAMRQGFRTGLAIPLVRRGEAIGTLTLRRIEVRPFTDEQIALVSSFANQAVIAIENAQLFEEVRGRNRDLAETLEQQMATGAILSAIAGSPTDIQPVLDVVAKSAAQLCNAFDATIYLRGSEWLSVGAHCGPIPISTTGLPLVRDVVTSRSVLDRSPIHIHDLTTAGDEFETGRQMAQSLGFRTILAVPLLRQGEAVGALMIRRTEVRPFTDKQIELLNTFADEAVIAIENVRLFTELEARNREILSRYFSPNLARRLAAGADEIELAGQRREVAAVFTDIESFTSLIERMEPGTLSDLLNGYLSGMTSVVFSHEGTVAKIVGDALHILFGAPVDQPDHAARAIACALDLDDFAQSFRETWRQKSTALGPTRIGVHAGPAIVGNFGGGRFFDYTAYGDTINIAARLEAANKQLGTRICVSESVARQALDFRGRPVGDLVLRGRSEPLRAFEPLRPEQFGDASTEAYLDAFAKLESANPDALGSFAAVVSSMQGDRLASFHLKRLLNGATGTRIEMD